MSREADAEVRLRGGAGPWYGTLPDNPLCAILCEQTPDWAVHINPVCPTCAKLHNPAIDTSAEWRKRDKLKGKTLHQLWKLKEITKRVFGRGGA